MINLSLTTPLPAHVVLALFGNVSNVRWKRKLFIKSWAQAAVFVSWEIRRSGCPFPRLQQHLSLGEHLPSRNLGIQAVGFQGSFLMSWPSTLRVHFSLWRPKDSLPRMLEKLNGHASDMECYGLYWFPTGLLTGVRLAEMGCESPEIYQTCVVLRIAYY